MSEPWRLPFGAAVERGGVRFRVWAPGHQAVEVEIPGPPASALHPLRAEGGGWFSARVPGAGAGTRYRYRLDQGDSFPDPASRAQPDGVHGASRVVDPAAFPWSDGGWRGVERQALVIYELHVGTFTPAGTFDGVVERLDALVELGVTAIELMPVAAFPGGRNWGYDGVDLFAPCEAYGGGEGLRRLVDAAHARGLAVLLDVVYNHLGPEGNYLPLLTGGRYLTSRHHTPWGDAINFAGADSGPVREFVIQNALHWAHEYHLDGLRLDATHAIVDESPRHLLGELAQRVRESLPPGRHFVLIAEDERNQRDLLLPLAEGGYGLDAVWADDLHHQLRVCLTGEREGYFAGFGGSASEIAETLRQGWWYAGQATPRGTPRGTPAEGIAPAAFVHCIQNHDQVGNRALGERLNHLIPLAAYRAASALLLLAPSTPLLWMGQEWAASSPFLYFTDHPEPLGAQVTRGRREEFRAFPAFSDPAARLAIPDPQAEETFLRSRLDWSERGRMPHAGVLRLYQTLLQLRRTHPALRARERGSFAGCAAGERTVVLRRNGEGDAALLLAAVLGKEEVVLRLNERTETAPPPGCAWRVHLCSEEARFAGEGGASAVLEGGVLRFTGPGAVVLEAVGEESSSRAVPPTMV